jgi:hypothetical protein
MPLQPIYFFLYRNSTRSCSPLDWGDAIATVRCAALLVLERTCSPLDWDDAIATDHLENVLHYSPICSPLNWGDAMQCWSGSYSRSREQISSPVNQGNLIAPCFRLSNKLASVQAVPSAEAITLSIVTYMASLLSRSPAFRLLPIMRSNL